MYDVVTIGNALLDVSLTVPNDNSYAELNQEINTISFRYGEKIHVENCIFSPGGNACNVGVGLARIGVKAALVAEMGDDEFAKRLLELLGKEPLDLSHILQTKDAASSFSVGVYYKEERTLFVQHVVREHAFPIASIDSQWIYLTSLGDEWKKPYEQVVSHAQKKGIKLAFSPGTHQYEEPGLLGIHKVLEKTDILFVNKEEAGRIASGISNFQMPRLSSKRAPSSAPISSDDKIVIKELLKVLQEAGPKTVVITDGKNGSFVLDGKKQAYTLGVFPCVSVGRTGAGDAYASGFLAAVVAGKDIPSAMRWGAMNAASVIEHVGTQTGLLKKEELEKRLQKAAAIQVETL